MRASKTPFCTRSGCKRILPALPRRTLSRKGLRVAVLFRGQLYRWGCSERGIALQQDAFASQLRHVVHPLQTQGNHVDVFATRQGQCDTHELERHLQVPHTVLDIPASEQRTQADAMRATLSAFFDEAGFRYDLLLITRSDVKILLAIDTWDCDPTDLNRLAFAGRCGASAWRGWKCTQDFFHAVPRAFYRSFNRSVGLGKPPGQTTGPCCFHPRCAKSAGHGCLGTLDLPAHNVSFCFPPVYASYQIFEPNAYFSLPQCADGLLAGLRPAVGGCRIREVANLSHGRPRPAQVRSAPVATTGSVADRYFAR